MRNNYGLVLNSANNTSKLSGEQSGRQIAPITLKEFVPSTITYPKSALLFLEGQASRGVFILYQGEVKVSICSSEGKRLIVRFAKAGEILGLTATLTGKPHEESAETICPCQVAFVHREEFLSRLTTYTGASHAVISQVIMQYQAICDQLRTIGLLSSVHQKLAMLLLNRSDRSHSNGDSVTVTLPLTHEEIAECIGTTRETVTRALSEFKHQRLLKVNGVRLTIPSRAALETFVNA
jgi:CRP/FNR family cyclic AMP-dependent transcriptional regulator